MRRAMKVTAGVVGCAALAASAAVLSGGLGSRAVPVENGMVRVVSPVAMDYTGPYFTLSAPSQTANVTEGATEVIVSFDAVTDPGFTKTAYPDVQFDGAKLTQVGGLTTGTAGTYRATFRTSADLPGGALTGTIAFRLCRETPCVHEYAGSAQNFAYTVNVKLRDWVTYQRDAAHTGYVHASYSGIVKKRWIWQPADTTLLTAVATKGSGIFITQSQQATPNYQTINIASFDTVGTLRWTTPLGHIFTAGTPAVVGDKVALFALSSFSSAPVVNAPVTLLNEADGTASGIDMRFSSPVFANFSAPTPYGGSLYAAVGYSGGETDAFNMTTGATSWAGYGPSDDLKQGQSPAVDENYVYALSGRDFNVFDRTTGATLKTIHNPFFTAGSTYLGGPMLGTAGNVITYLSPGAPGNERILSNISVPLGRVLWSLPGYVNQPAIARGVIYAAKRGSFDAIDEATGNVLWSWTLPADDQFRYNLSNTIVTDTLAFVGSENRLYAISLTDPAHPTVWYAMTPGHLAISSDNMLLVTTVLAGKPTLVGYSLGR